MAYTFLDMFAFRDNKKPKSSTQVYHSIFSESIKFYFNKI